MIFFVGLHMVNHAAYVLWGCISVNRLRRRKTGFIEPLHGWMMDSGAFTEISRHGEYRTTAAEYAREAARWVTPRLKCIVAQDYMCEPFILKKTGLTVAEHQRRTVQRYDELVAAWEAERQAAGRPEWWPPVMPVLQGWTVADYEAHVVMYGDRLTPGMWVGVGSVCKRQGAPAVIVAILSAILALRPDLKLHGFGVKLIALAVPAVRKMLATADSLAWSFAARYEGRDQNSAIEALRYVAKVDALTRPA